MTSRMRKNRSQTRQGRNHHALAEARLSKCEKCGSDHIRHRACAVCGSYRGREVINTTKALEKKLQKQQSKKAEQEEATS